MRCFFLAVIFASIATAQVATKPDPEFEVASVRPTAFPNAGFAGGFYAGAASSGCMVRDAAISGTRVSLAHESVCDLIAFAYGVRGFQVAGAPSLPASTASGPQDAAALVATHPGFFYDIEARAPGADAPSEAGLRAMVRGLLADRFALRVHHEIREMSYYAVVIGKRGTKMTPSRSDCSSTMGVGPDVIVHVCGASIEHLLQGLNNALDKPVR